MQTVTSIRGRGWSGRIASLPLSFFIYSRWCRNSGLAGAYFWPWPDLCPSIMWPEIGKFGLQ